MRKRATIGLIGAFLSFLVACGGSSTSPPPSPPIPDFMLQVQPSNVGLVLGNSSQIHLSESSLNGFTGTVSVNTNALPAGVTINPALPQNVGTSGLDLSINSGISASSGNYTLSFTGTSGSLQHSTNLALSLGKRANVSITVPTQTVNVVQGGNTSVPIDINTDSGIVDFSVQIQALAPIGISASFTSNVVLPNTAISLNLAVAPSVAAGPGSVTIQTTRSVDGVQVSTAFPIYVDPKPGTIAGNRTNWVRLGSNPIAAFYDKARNHLFASLPAMNRVVMLDPNTGRVLSSIPTSVAIFEPNGVWLASSSNISGSLDGKSLLVLGAGHVATIDLASAQVTAEVAIPKAIPIGWTTPTGISPTFLVSAAGSHIIFGSWGDSSFYNWDGSSPVASLHPISDLYSFDRSFDGSKVLVASGDTSGAYQLLDVASDSITAQGAYSNAVIMTVRGNPVSSEWALANSNGVDFLDKNLNFIARVPATFSGSITYWGMTYSSDGKFLYFVCSPDGVHPFQITVDDTTHHVVRIAPATGTTLAYFRRSPPDWIVQPFAADSSGLVFGLGEKGIVIDDSTYNIDPTQATTADFAIIATPDSGPVNGSTPVQITTQSYAAQPDVWFGTQRALVQGLNSAGQVSATAPPGQVAGPVNIKLFPPDGYVHVMPQAFTYGTVITSVRYSLCQESGGCSADIFGFGLFGTNSSQTRVTIGGNVAPVQSVHYFNTVEPYPYPLQYVTVTVPPGLPGRAEVTVTTGTGQATLTGGFLYGVSLQSFPSPKTYNALLYDQSRGVLYASTDSQIVRFSPSSSTFLAPITPPSTTGQNQFQGISLTPDGSRLIVANKQDVSVAIIDPDNPSNAQVVPIPGVTSGSGGPVFVAATAVGKVLISIGGFSFPWTGPLYELDLATLQVQTVTIPGTIPRDQMGLYPTSDGKIVFVRTYGGFAGFWDPTTGQFSAVNDNFAGAGLGAAAGDGNVFAVGLGFVGPDGSSLIGWGVPDELGGFQGIFANQAALNDSGSLEFVLNSNNLLVFDTHHGDLLQSATLPNQTNVWTQTIALDAPASRVFISDSQGLTVLTLASSPLALGSVTPSTASVGGGTVLNLRGSGFDTTTTVSIGGKMAGTAFVDPSTLQVTAPANSAGPGQITIQKPDGETYQLDGAVVYQ